MHFSCKISNAIISVIEGQGEDITALYDAASVPAELLRDPSYWISAPEMEAFLEAAHRIPLKKEFNICQKAGHEGPELRPWGVLDSVLKMMPHPQEVFSNPEQFLSYFISPKPPVDNIRREEHSLSFDLPLPAEQYPLVSCYLKAAFEALPLYVGQPAATCEWEGITIKLTWSNQQKSIFGEELGRQVSPELFKSLIEDLQQTQREREDLQKYISDLEAKIRDYEKRLVTEIKSSDETATPIFPSGPALGHINFDQDTPSYKLGQNLARMHDYMVRAQQLITMLAAQGKVTPAVKEAMRRVDWEFVKTQYPRTVSESMEIVRKIDRKSDATTESLVEKK